MSNLLEIYYLREFHFTNEIFNSLSNFTGDHEKCIFNVDKKLEVLSNKRMERINSETKHRTDTICTERQLSKSHYYPKILLLEIVDFSKISWKFWTYFERQKKFEELMMG